MQLRAFPRRRIRARGERGFTMLLALYVLTITSLLLGGAYVAVLTDTHLSRNDLDQKRAYAAAQAGIEQYDYDLNQNPNYWENCPTPGGTIGASDSGSTETYVDTPIVASTAPSGTTACSTSNPIGTMVEAGTLTGGGTNPAAGTFRITRRVRDGVGPLGQGVLVGGRRAVPVSAAPGTAEACRCRPRPGRRRGGATPTGSARPRAARRRRRPPAPPRSARRR